ncbi:hypothetical protein [Dactylosporangium darangshiense]|uniref:hypothetical protein n=1 Tax=Dactylosporangium darangshiense TaxID=579108 RepID=UPI00363190A5
MKWLHAQNYANLGISCHPTAAGQAGGFHPVFGAAAGWSVGCADVHPGPRPRGERHQNAVVVVDLVGVGGGQEKSTGMTVIFAGPYSAGVR